MGFNSAFKGLREEYRLRAFENRVLRKIFGLMRGEVTGDWRKLHNVELCILYTSSHIIQVNELKRNGWMSTVSGIWSTVSGIWSTVSGIWSTVSGIWSTVSGIWSTVSGILSTVSGIWSTVSGIWKKITFGEER